MRIKQGLWHLRNAIAKRYAKLNFIAGRHDGLVFDERTWRIAKPYKGIELADQNLRTIFLHIPKTGGTTVDLIFGAATTYSNRAYKRFNILGSSNNVIYEGWSGASPNIFSQDQSTLDKYDNISGHFPFGVHTAWFSKARYITLIRHPVDREISSLNFMYQTGFAEKGTNIQQLIASGKTIDNPQTRLLAGQDYMSGQCDDSTFETALKNLENWFDLVGVTDFEDEFIAAMLGQRQWPSVVFSKNNVTQLKVAEKPTDSDVALLLSYHNYDVRLYTLAKEAWKRNYHNLTPQDQSHGSDVPDNALLISRDFRETGQVKMIAKKDIERILQTKHGSK